MNLESTIPPLIESWTDDIETLKEGLPRLTPELKAWLSSRGSLTFQLQQRFSKLNYRLLFAGNQQPFESERQPLMLSESLCWTRHVHFGESGRSYVFSKVVVSGSSGHSQSVVQWGHTPLGELLFGVRQLVRERIEYQVLTPQSEYLNLAERYVVASLPFAIARRSLFYDGALSILVTDVFLPDFMRSINGT